VLTLFSLGAIYCMKLFLRSYVDKLSEFVFKREPQRMKKPKPEIVSYLTRAAGTDTATLLSEFSSSEKGISMHKSKELLGKYGRNEIIREKRELWPIRLAKTFYNPLILLLLVLAIISFLTSDMATSLIIGLMVLVSIGLRYYEEEQAYNAAEKLRFMVKTTCTVIREDITYEIGLKYLVPGDVILLSAGDLIPADVRLLESKDLFANQSLLTGEALAVEKHANVIQKGIDNIFDLQNLCLMGTNVDSGSAHALVIATGSKTYFGSFARTVVGPRILTSFDKGVDRFTWLMIGFMLVMSPLVFLINGFSKGNWLEAFLFATSVAVGLTPAMLPAILTINLSKGAIIMSKKKVIVKRLNSIQNFGAMDILCTDKTGTLTQNKVVVIQNINILGKTDPQVLHYAYINSLFQTGFKNLLDGAILDHGKASHVNLVVKNYKKIDELPFDFVRRRMSVVVQNPQGIKLLLCKGAVEELTSICKEYEVNGVKQPIAKDQLERIRIMNEDLSKDGFRVVAVGYKEVNNGRIHYEKADEKDLIFIGFMTFLDPPKESATSAIAHLLKNGIDIKVLTGDNELVTRKISKEVGLPVAGVLLGAEIETLKDSELRKVVDKTTIFAKLLPDHKKRVVEALQKNGHVVGFLGDGINDASALRASDVGISVDSAVDIAKEAADIILLEVSLGVLNEGVIEGRKVFANIIKYIKMGASSNFGNIFSVMGASLFLPFLPMLPLQLLTNNLLYDISQTAIPTDNVDKEYIEKPRKWQVGDIRRFMLFIGPISSIFDYVTFGVMIFIFHALNNPALFQTGWFIESLLTQTLIVHVIRSKKIPFVQTWASKPLILTTLIIMAIGIVLPFSPIGKILHFVAPPINYWPILALILLSYIGLTQVVKTWYIRKFGYN